MISLNSTFLRGSFPPVVTPFRGGKVDYNQYASLIERQVDEGSQGVVVAGTTGEPSSLSIEERNELCRIAVGIGKNKIQVVAATGSQSLAETLHLTREAERIGADALLIVTPYYIKPSQRGLVEYFTEVGRNTSLPWMVYHIPGRAAVSVKRDTIVSIAERVPHLVGIKHADHNLELLTELLMALGSEFRIFCGLEALSLPMLVLGASGLMNAVGNVAPGRVTALYEAVVNGDLDRARDLHTGLFELNQSIFLDTNPIPLKYMMQRLGLLESAEVRLPLTSLDAKHETILDGVLERAGFSVASLAAGN